MNSLHLVRFVRLAFVFLILVVAVFAVFSADDFRRAAKLFPQYAGAALAILCALELLNELLKRKFTDVNDSSLNTADIGLDQDELSIEGWRRSLIMMAWVVGYMTLIALFGIPIATALFVPAMLRFRFKASVVTASLIVVGLWLLMWVLIETIAMKMPSGILFGSFPF